MTHDRAWIARHLPHKGEMSLLDAIVAWDETTVRAITGRHRALDHPLRSGDRLHAVCGVEFAAQAAAAHGALCSSKPSDSGFLAAVRSVRLHALRLDDIAGDLEIEAEQLGAGAGGVVYAFTVSGAGRVLVEGRLTVAFAR